MFSEVMTNALYKDILISFSIFLAFLLLRKVFVSYVFKFLLRMAGKIPTDVLKNILTVFERPARVLFIILGLYFSLLYLPYVDAAQDIITRLFRSSIIVLVAWGIYNLDIVYSGLLKNIGKNIGIQFDEIIVPFLSKIIKLITVLLAISIIAQEWDYEVSGFIAGLGLGGLAFALAAQDSLSNLFGGMVIIVDKPFTVGDWISTPSVEGIVEDITFRSTKVRTFAQAIVTVPNSKLANEPITNWAAMGKRQITFHLKVAYSTPRAKLEKCVERIKTTLIEHPDVHKQTIFVVFDRYNDSSLDIFLYFFTITTVWQEFLMVKQDINFKIMRILEEEGVSMGLPTTNVHLESRPDLKVNPQQLDDVELNKPESALAE
ncbi:MAG: mechanosensitive ion channel family protein [Bacillota bacterium]|jgi:MscS family membrane protein